LDAVRGFALLLGVAFHAALSFMPGWPPGIWAMNDNSPSQFLSDAAFVTHIFRMSLFFFIAGFFARLGGTVREVHRMSLEEIFVANVMHHREARGQ
jgi:hypothetical protein